MSKVVDSIKNGIFKENPVFVQIMGMCPTLAVTTSALNGLAMGLATTAVLIMSNLFISILKGIIPSKVRIPAYIVVIASFVTIIQFLLEAYLPSLNNALGIFIPLIVVNCLILARAEGFASKNNPIASIFDGIGMGLGFTLGLFVLGSIRELIGTGGIFGIEIWARFIPDTIIFILPPGAFLTLGFILAFLNYYSHKKGGK